MLKKIDCVTVRVDDAAAAAAYYTRVFGVQWLWTETARDLLAPHCACLT